ncbi:PLD nuclease N-terminal domain-containing protein [Chloroflexota bacterium]
MGISPEWIVRVVLFGIVHWVLAILLLNDLASRNRVFGGRKPPWAMIILLIPCFGSIFYLLFHPQILNPDNRRNERHDEKREN